MKLRHPTVIVASAGTVLLVTSLVTALFAATDPTLFAPLPFVAGTAIPDPSRVFEPLEDVLGREAPDFRLKNLNGEIVSLRDVQGRMPTVIEFGSFTCPYCTKKAWSMDRLADQFQGRVRFLFVYGPEAHPGASFLPGPDSLDRSSFCAEPSESQRRASARIFRDVLGVRRNMLIDDLTSPSLRERYIPGPWIGNALAVVNPEQRIVYAACWLNLDLLESFLKSYLTGGGKVEPEAYKGGP